MAKSRSSTAPSCSRARTDAPGHAEPALLSGYFAPEKSVEVHKSRREFHIRYGGTDFAVSFDQILKPEGD